MSDFNPTHEFQGLKLEHHEVDGYIDGLGSYYDERGTQYRLSSDVVTKILPQPKPGEVWKYIGEYAGVSDSNLVLITEDAKASFVNVEGDTIQFSDGDHRANFVKVLNADGTPA